MKGMGSRVYLGGLPYHVVERDVREFFRGYGILTEILLKNGHGFVEFDDWRDAEDAVIELDGATLCGERISVEFARGTPKGTDRYYSKHGGYYGYGRSRWAYMENYGPPIRTEYSLLVENLSSRVSWQDLKDIMRQAGEVTYADAHRNGEHEGIVEFATYKDMRSALVQLNGVLIEGRRIRLVKKYHRRRRSISSRSRSMSRSRSRIRSTSRSRSKSGDRGSVSSHSSRGSSHSSSSSSSSSGLGSRGSSLAPSRRNSHSRSRSYSRSCSRSRSYSRDRSRSRSLSRSRSRTRSYSRSRPTRRIWRRRYGRPRSLSRSRSRSRSYSRSRSRSYSRTREIRWRHTRSKTNWPRSHSRSRSRSRSFSQSRSRSRSRSYSWSRSHSRNRSCRSRSHTRSRRFQLPPTDSGNQATSGPVSSSSLPALEKEQNEEQMEEQAEDLEFVCEI